MWNNHSDRLRRPEVLKIFLTVKNAYKNRKLVSLKQYDFYSQHSQIISKYFSDSCRKSGWLFQYTDMLISNSFKSASSILMLIWKRWRRYISILYSGFILQRRLCGGQVIALFHIREAWDFLFIMIQNGENCKKFLYMKTAGEI